MIIRETLQQAGFIDAEPIGDNNEWVLTEPNGTKEIWFENPGHASYGISLDDGTELEFSHSL